jgi:tRNA modification GTPase
MIPQDSIVALATPSGAGAIDLISGQDAIAIGNSVKSIKTKN